jgi:hypothetical protein
MRTRQDLICRRLTIAVISIAFGILFGANRAHAESAEAEKLFTDGNKLMADGKLAEACAAFEASNRVEPRAGTLLRLGECREKKQQLASAWSAYKDARNLATDPRKRQFATTRAAALEPRLSYLTVAVSDQVRIRGLVLTRNGTSFDPMLWNRALPVDGGDYVMAGRAPGYETWQRTVHAPLEGAKLSVDVPALTKASSVSIPEGPPPSTPPNPPSTAPTPPSVNVPVSTVVQQNVNVAAPPPPSVVVVPVLDHSPASPQTSSKVVPLAVGAGALALLGGGLGFELWAESRYAAAKSEMTSQLRRESLYNSANTKRYVAEAVAVSGLAAGGAAVWLYLRNDNRERDATTNAGMHVVPTATGLALAGQF